MLRSPTPDMEHVVSNWNGSSGGMRLACNWEVPVSNLCQEEHKEINTDKDAMTKEKFKK
jgi:hypothetical protein